MKNIQQLLAKDKESGEWIHIYPLSFVETVYNGATGERLDNILFHFNCIAVPYKGTIYDTRNSVRKQFRRKGLEISYIMTDGTIKIERYTAMVVDDRSWGDDENWESASNRDIPKGSITSESLSRELLEYLEGVVGQKGDKGDPGDDGEAATISVGTVHTVQPNEEAKVVNSGTPNKAMFDFWIPRGVNGTTPDLEVGNVETLDPGTDAGASITGPLEFPKLNLFIPRGDKGDFFFMVLNTNSIFVDAFGIPYPGELHATIRRIDGFGDQSVIPCYYQIDESLDGVDFHTVYRSGSSPEKEMTPFKLPGNDECRRCYMIKAFLDPGFDLAVSVEYIWRVKDGEPNTPQEVIDMLKAYLKESGADQVAFITDEGDLVGGGSYEEFEEAVLNELPDALK